MNHRLLYGICWIIILLGFYANALYAQGTITLAGNGASGYVDDTGTLAFFNSPRELAVDGSGNIYIADRFNHRVRKITPAGVVTTFAGSGVSGGLDGIGVAARFNSPTGMVIDNAAGILYVTDRSGHRVRKIDLATASVTTLAGSTVMVRYF